MRRNREINLKVSDCEIWREKERKPTLALGFCFIFVFVVLKFFFLVPLVRGEEALVLVLFLQVRASEQIVFDDFGFILSYNPV